MALQDIVALLKKEGEDNATALLSAAEEKATSIVESMNESIRDFESTQSSLREEESLSLLKKADAQILHEERSSRAKMQEAVLESVFDDLGDKLLSASEGDLEKIFTSFIASIADDKGTVVALGKTSTVALKNAVALAKKKFSVEIDEASLAAGFIFKGESFTMDFSYDAILRAGVRPKYESDIFKKLFS